VSKQRAARRATPPPRRGPSSSAIVLGVGALVIVVAAVAAIALTQTGGGSSTFAPSGSSASGGSTPPSGALPPYANGGVDPAVGQKAPEVDGAGFDGSPVAITADGRPKLLLFIAHWCPHCQAEVPVVQRWLDAGKLPAGVDLISVASANDPAAPNYPPDAWLAREKWTPPVIVDGDGQIALAYGLTAFPYWVVVDADGNVVQRLTGELTPEQLDALITGATSG
jgi:thiol-disulfide isomerase/thioredoxin